MAIEVVDFPIKNGGSFHSKLLVYQAGYFPIPSGDPIGSAPFFGSNPP